MATGIEVKVSKRGGLLLRTAAGAGTIFIVALLIASIQISRHLPDVVPAWLSQHYNSSVQLSDFHASISFPILRCEADNVTLRFEGREDLPPMIAMRKLTVSASIWGLLRNPVRIHSVYIEGLELTIPPREANGNGHEAQNFMHKARDARFDEMHADGAILKFLTRKPGKDPREFDIGQLSLASTDPEGALIFRAKLSNPTPPGVITSSGTFGPWNLDSPSLTPVKGSYVFENANLGVFKGIAGTLSSNGKFNGVLEKIEVDGTTDTPDFRVTQAGHTLHLKTTFAATVDGTDGDTYLHPVVSYFGKTTLTAQGKIERIQGKPGRIISLDVTVDDGRIEDLLLLAVKEKPPMTGPIRLKTKFKVNPGPANILERLSLDSSFALNSIHFTDAGVQQRVDNMSVRSEGRPKEVKKPAEATTDDDVAAGVNGRFRLDKGMLALSGVQFRIPGADMQISGTYTIEAENLDLDGRLTMNAALSQTTTGAKSVLLRLADPFFWKNGHTVLPIKITGSVQHPHYGLELHRKQDKTADAIK